MRAFAVAAVCLALTACTTLTQLAYSNAAFAYTNLQPMVAWWVEDYVDMSARQKDWVRERVARYFDWHRAEQLPEYRRFLERVLAEADEPFTIAEVREAYLEVRAHLRRAAEQALPDVADFLLQLDPEQVAQIEKRMAEGNRKYLRESVKGTPEERRARRAKRFAQHLEGWLGEVTDAQHELIAAHYREMPEVVEDRLAETKVRQGEMIALARAKPGREQLTAGLRRLALEGEQFRRGEYRQALAERNQRLFALLAELSATLTPGQRAYLKKRIRGYMGDIAALTASRSRG